MLHRASTLAILVPATLVLAACRSQGAGPDALASSQPAAHANAAPVAAAAEIGRPAPDFDLADLDGKHVKLSDFKGKTVVLEWFNPGCPFVKASHTKGSLKDTAKRAVDKGIVWLAVNSGGPGKQGYGAQANKDGAATFGMTHPILLDESGTVGHLYGATNTPNMFVVDPKGVLVYAGAIDNSPDGEGDSPTDGKLVNYVEQALADLAAGRPVTAPKTRPYGCSVKFASKS
jgi:peroxiredoxin